MKTQRRMKKQERVKVTVLVDSYDEDDERTCFWREFKKDHDHNNEYFYKEFDKDYNFNFVCISEKVAEVSGIALVDKTVKANIPAIPKKSAKANNPLSEIFNDENNIVIINWDALNGDPLYQSDKEIQFFHHFLPDIDLWVRKGGILVVECQEGSRTLQQEVYDLFGKDLGYPLKIKESKKYGSKVHYFKDSMDHPLLDGIDAEEEEERKEKEKEKGKQEKKRYEYEVKNLKKYTKTDLYPKNKYSEDARNHKENELWKKKIFLGWFAKYRNRDWEQLIFAKSKEIGKDRPVMLCRLVPNCDKKLRKMSLEEAEKYTIGAYIITSMFIGSSAWRSLIKNILNFQGAQARYACIQYFKKRQARRNRILMWTTIGTIGIAAMVLTGIYYPGQYGPIIGGVITGIGWYFVNMINKKFIVTKTT